MSGAHGALVLQTQINNGLAPSPLLPIAGDLLETSVLTATGENASALVRNGAFTDVPSGNTLNFPAQVWGAANATTTYDFDLSTNTFGYSITAIQAYSAWADNRCNQNYRIFYAQVGAPATFIQLGGDIQATGSGDSIITRYEDNVFGVPILSNVSSIRFEQIAQIQGDSRPAGFETVFRELDVVGIGSIPEPTTSVLGLCGALLLFKRRRS